MKQSLRILKMNNPHLAIETADDARCLCRMIDYKKPGPYSLDNDDIYQYGKRATHSRIYIKSIK